MYLEPSNGACTLNKSRMNNLKNKFYFLNHANLLQVKTIDSAILMTRGEIRYIYILFLFIAII